MADLDDHRLDEVHDPLLVDETHLEVQLREFGLSVSAQILVAEATGNLEVSVHAGDHEQLLELLRALRQGIDAAGLEPAGNDEVSCAFRRRLQQDRSFDLDETGPMVGVADCSDKFGSQQQPIEQGLAPDVEIAVLEPQAFVDGRIRFVDVERWRLGLVEYLHGLGPNLDRACRELCVFRPR